MSDLPENHVCAYKYNRKVWQIYRQADGTLYGIRTTKRNKDGDPIASETVHTTAKDVLELKPFFKRKSPKRKSKHANEVQTSI